MKLPNFIKNFIEKYKVTDKYLVRNYGPNRAERRAAKAMEKQTDKPAPYDTHAASRERGLSKIGKLMEHAGIKSNL